MLPNQQQPCFGRYGSNQIVHQGGPPEPETVPRIQKVSPPHVHTGHAFLVIKPTQVFCSGTLASYSQSYCRMMCWMQLEGVNRRTRVWSHPFKACRSLWSLDTRKPPQWLRASSFQFRLQHCNRTGFISPIHLWSGSCWSLSPLLLLPSPRGSGNQHPTLNLSKTKLSIF